MTTMTSLSILKFGFFLGLGWLGAFLALFIGVFSFFVCAGVLLRWRTGRIIKRAAENAAFREEKSYTKERI